MRRQLEHADHIHQIAGLGLEAAGVTRTKVVSPAIDRFRGKAYLLDPFRYNITSTSIDLML
jgi:hypothetical protein